MVVFENEIVTCLRRKISSHNREKKILGLILLGDELWKTE